LYSVETQKHTIIITLDSYTFRSLLDSLQANIYHQEVQSVRTILLLENTGLEMVWKRPKHIAILGCWWL